MTVSEKNMIECDHIYFSYNNKRSKKGSYIVDDFDLQIKKGEFVAVLGLNGCGKSTVAKHLNALLRPSEGTVKVDGIRTDIKEKLKKIRSKVGMVFQNPDNQIVASIVENEVAFGPENYGIDREEIKRRVDEGLEKINMENYAKTSPRFLSGGQKQRIAIAGILALDPECIVLDEPTAMLDPCGRKDVLKTIKELNKEHGMTIIIITHYMEEAAQADRVIVMEKGKVKLDDTPRNIFSNVDEIRSIGLDVPQVTELLYHLHRSGADVRYDILNVEEASEVLWEYLHSI